jgi:hypothetical protein
VLIVAVAACMVSAWQALVPADEARRARWGDPTAPLAEQGDEALYRAVRARLVAGAPYYPSLRAELEARGYPTRSVLNWRPPAHLTLLSWMPDPGPAWLLGGLCGVAAAGLVWRVLGGALGFRVAALLLVQLGALGAAGVLFSEAWAGALLMLAAVGLLAADPVGGARSFGASEEAPRRVRSLHPTLAAGLRLSGGLAALLMRELAAPACLALFSWALIERRRREALAWAIGCGGIAALYALHLAAVAVHRPVDGLGREWLSWGGPLRALGTLRYSFPAVLGAPLGPWVVAAIGWAAVAPIAEAPRIRLVALVVLGYLGLFSMVGSADNDYWGCLLAGPVTLTSALGLVGAVRTLRSV